MDEKASEETATSAQIAEQSTSLSDLNADTTSLQEPSTKLPSPGDPIVKVEEEGLALSLNFDFDDGSKVETSNPFLPGGADSSTMLIKDGSTSEATELTTSIGESA